MARRTAAKQPHEEITGLRKKIAELEALQKKYAQTEELVESRAKYEAIVEAFDGLIYICSDDYKIEFMNKRFVERSGHDTVGEACYKAIHGLGEVCPWCVNQKVFRGKTVSWEVLSPKDNRWYYVVNTPIKHPDGRVSKMAMIHDITERKQAQEDLRRRRERTIGFQKALLELVKMDNSDWAAAVKKITTIAAKNLAVERVGICLFDKERTEVACEDLFILSSGAHEKGQRFPAKQYPRYFQALEKGCLMFARDAHQEGYIKEFYESYLKPLGVSSTMDVPIWFRRKIAGVVCYEHVGPPRPWEGEEQDFAVAISEAVSLTLEASEAKKSDVALQEAHTVLEMRVQRRTMELVKANIELKNEIAERARIEETLKASKVTYRAIFENTGTAMAILEEDMTIAMVNNEFEKLSGFSKKDVEGKKTYLDFAAEEDRATIKDRHYLRRQRPEAASRTYEFRFRNRKGGIRDVFATSALIPGTKQSVVSLMDITE